MVEGFGSNQNKHGLGYTPKPRKNNKKKIARFVANPTLYYNYGVNESKKYANLICHFCNCKGHVSYDCFARSFPNDFIWRPKQKTNIVVTKWVPSGALSAGASTSSNT